METTLWMNFYVNKSDVVSMLDEDPHTTEQDAVEQVSDWDGHADVHGTVWTYTHSIYMNGGNSEIINLTATVKERRMEEARDLLREIPAMSGMNTVISHCMDCDRIYGHQYTPYSIGSGIFYKSCACRASGNVRLNQQKKLLDRKHDCAGAAILRRDL